MKNSGSIFTWAGIVLVAIGLIIVIALMPGWLWCLLGALVLIAAGLFLIRPFFRR